MIPGQVLGAPSGRAALRGHEVDAVVGGRFGPADVEEVLRDVRSTLPSTRITTAAEAPIGDQGFSVTPSVNSTVRDTTLGDQRQIDPTLGWGVDLNFGDNGDLEFFGHKNLRDSSTTIGHPGGHGLVGHPLVAVIDRPRPHAGRPP